MSKTDSSYTKSRKLQKLGGGGGQGVRKFSFLGGVVL